MEKAAGNAWRVDLVLPERVRESQGSQGPLHGLDAAGDKAHVPGGQDASKRRSEELRIHDRLCPSGVVEPVWVSQSRDF
jgi:hypothetical protein